MKLSEVLAYIHNTGDLEFDYKDLPASYLPWWDVLPCGAQIVFHDPEKIYTVFYEPQTKQSWVVLFWDDNTLIPSETDIVFDGFSSPLTHFSSVTVEE